MCLMQKPVKKNNEKGPQTLPFLRTHCCFGANLANDRAPLSVRNIRSKFVIHLPFTNHRRKDKIKKADPIDPTFFRRHTHIYPTSSRLNPPCPEHAPGRPHCPRLPISPVVALPAAAGRGGCCKALVSTGATVRTRHAPCRI